MANLSRTKTLFAFTSPRTLEKIIPEVKLLTDNFSGKKWTGNQDLQADYFDVLFNSEYYEGDRYPSDAALAARDRITRAPKALGFVDLEPEIQLTPVGIRLLSNKRISEVITKQLLKFQLPSPFHPKFPISFNVRPYLELLRLIDNLGSVSKTEIAIFFLQLVRYDSFDKIINKLVIFRNNAKTFKGSRRTYVSETFVNEILSIYKDEIKLGKIKTRESPEISLQKFVRTKQSNMLDYADAYIRYIRATQLVTFEKNTYRLIISPFKKDEVKYILKKIPRAAFSFTKISEYKSYLFSDSNLQLLNDNKSLLLKKLLKYKAPLPTKIDLEKLKDKVDEVELKLKEKVIEDTKRELKDFKEFDDIINVFHQILKKSVPDPPLFLEWNVWRSFVMLNYASRIAGNLVLDFDGMPLATAPGKKPDIEIEFSKYGLIVEVTMSTGDTQFKMENESVPRHFGRAKEEIKTELYCIFIAPSISSGTLAHYFNLNRLNTRLYGGKTKIIPLSINQFIQFLFIAKENGFNNPSKLNAWLEQLWLNNQKSRDENNWYEHISNSISTWLS